MSVIAGIVRFDGAPVDTAAVDRMAARIGARAPDGVTIASADAAVFVAGRLASVAGSEAESMVAIDRAAGVWLIFDGRLDNRGELAAALKAAADESDAELALLAFVTWGPAAPAHFLGDFAFAAWEPAERRLTLARDTAGVRMLMYREGPGWIAFASAVDLLAVIPPVPAPNEGMLAEHLTAFIVHTRETVFRDIWRVPPAHRLVATARHHALQRYWQPEPDRVLADATDEEYEEHLRAVLTDAIAARLRANGPAGVMLSGGVDSSAVTAIAAGLQRANGVAATAIESFSISIGGAGDERAFFEAVTSQYGIAAHRLETALPRRGQFREEAARDLEVPAFPHAPTLDRLRALARDRGVRVLLTGMGGDDWLGASQWAMADLLTRGRWIALASRLREEAAADDFPGWTLALHAATWPWLPAPARRTVRRVLGRERNASWIEPAFASRVSLADRVARRPPPLRFPTFEQEDLWQEGTGGTLVHAIESAGRGVAHAGIDHWHPYFDRRVIEFGLALPADQRWRHGRAKDLLRRAMAPLLPATVVGRATNPSADHVLAQAIAAESTADEIGTWAVVRRGWAKAAELQRLYAEADALYRAGRREYARPAWIVWNALATSLWLDAAGDVK